MSIPVYRHNLDYDDWEVASVYDSDDGDSLGRSADDDSLHSGYFDDPALRSGCPVVLHDDIRRRIEYPMPIPMPQPQLQPQQQKQHEIYSPMTHSPRRWETWPLAGQGSGYAPSPAPIVPPPGVIFPRQDWVHSPPQPQQDAAYWHSPPSTPTLVGHGHYGHGHGTHSSVLPDSLPVYQSPPMPPPPPMADVPDRMDRMDRMELSPPTSSLLLAPSSPPPPVPCGLIRRPSPSAMIGHGQAPHATSLTMPSVQGTGMIGIGSSSVSMNTYTAPSPPPPPAPMMPPPPRYHEVAHYRHNHHHAMPMPMPMSPRCLAEAGCQARSRSSSQSQSHTHTPSSHPHPGMGTRSSSPNPRRQPGHGEHDVLSPYVAAGPGLVPRGRRSSEDTDVIGVDGRYAGNGSHGPGAGDRPDLHATSPSSLMPPVHWQGKYEREYDADGGRGTSTRKTRPLTRERRPSMWQRFVRRFSPSRASIGQT